MFCTKCGEKMEEGTKFCTNCGNALVAITQEINTEKSPEKKNVGKEDFIGMAFGISLAWSIGLGGFIPYTVGLIFGVWFTRKIFASKKKNIVALFWVLFVVVFLIGSTVRTITADLQSQTLNLESGQPVLLETDKSSEISQISGDMYRNTKYHFRIKFPEDWKIETGDGLHVVQKASYKNSTISVIIQQFDLGGLDGFTSIKDAGTAKEFIDTAMEGITAKFSDVKVKDYGETKIDNQTAYWVEYSATSQVLNNTLEMTNLNYFLAKDDTIYTISAGTASVDYVTVEPLFNRSVETFVLEN